MNSLKSRMQEVFDQMYEDIAEEGLQPVLNDDGVRIKRFALPIEN